jgi:hypothetical protein
MLRRSREIIQMGGELGHNFVILTLGRQNWLD